MPPTIKTQRLFEYTLQDWIEVHRPFNNYEGLMMRYAKNSLRNYACLYNRYVKKYIINERSVCAKCNTKEYLTIDHIKPVSLGGENTLDNIQILCKSCNFKKGNRV
jgi:5-methylcytosine-specific restriction endonuclease McrA